MSMVPGAQSKPCIKHALIICVICTGFPANTICSSRPGTGWEKIRFHNKSGDFVIPIGMILKIHQNGWAPPF